MNMVTKSGGNRFTSDHNFYFMNDALQGSNIDDDLRARLGLQPGQETGAAGNPIDISYDWSSTLGGPIARDKAWFFGAIRWWRLDQFQIGACNPDGSQAIDDNRIRNFVGKATWQTTPTIRTSFLFNKNINDRFHRRDSPYLFVEDKATVLQNQPAQNYVVQYNHVVGRRAGARRALRPDVGRLPGALPGRRCGPTDIAIRDVVRFTRINAAETQSLNPNGRYQGNFTGSYFLDSAGAGTHDLKAGLQLSWERVEYERIRNGDIFLELQDGRPFQAQLSNTPINSDHRLQTWGVFLQDRWVVGRATINAGLRIDGVSAHLPAQTSPAGTYVEARSFPKADVFDFGPNVAPRLGISYDLFGNGRTALKAYYGRFYNQFGSQISEAANPNAIVNQAVAVDRHQRQRWRSIPASWAPSPASRAGCSRPWTAAPRVPTARSTTSASSSSWPATWPCRRQLPSPRAPQRARHPRPRPRLRRLHADRAHLRRSDQRADASDHHLQPASPSSSTPATATSATSSS